MSYTAVKKELNGVTLYDSTSKLRTNLVKLFIHNSFDVGRFYLFMAKLSQIPLLGTPLKKALYLYYRYLQTNSIILPVKDIEEIIEEASDLCVGPCVCRTLTGEEGCGGPVYTCMGINFNASFRVMEKHSKRITKCEALEIIANGNRHGLVMSLESCIQPYQGNICMCCSDCCLPMQIRYRYGVPIFNSGPYLPEQTKKKCNECYACVKRCPVKAISVDDRVLSIDPDMCLGCGLCAQACSRKCIEMVKIPGRVRADSEPGQIRMLLSVAYVYIMMIPAVLLFRLIAGSRQYLNNPEARKTDVFDGQFMN